MNVFSIINTLQTHGSLVALQGYVSLVCSLHHSMKIFPYCIEMNAHYSVHNFREIWNYI